MAIPDPPKRRERKALLYLDELQARVLTDPTAPVDDTVSAALYAQAMVLVALFGEPERQLLRDVYHSHTAGDCLYDVRAACACEGQDQLCVILDMIIAQMPQLRPMVDYMIDLIESDAWRRTAEEIAEREFTADHFVWWAFDPDR